MSGSQRTFLSRSLLGTLGLASMVLAVAAIRLGVIAVTGGRSAVHSGNPKPIVREAAYVFPPALPGSFVQRTFFIRNSWSRTLRLDSLEPSCVCTKGFLTRNKLMPGESARLTLVILLDQYSSGDRLGAILRGTVGGRRIRFVYILRVRAAYPLDFSSSQGIPYAGTTKIDGSTIRLIGHGAPDYFDFGDMYLGERTRSLPPVAVTRGVLPMAWTRVTCSTDDPGLRAQLQPAGKDRWLLYLSYKPNKYLGDVASHVIFTFLERGKPLKYRMYKTAKVNIRGPIYLSEPTLLIGSVKQGESLRSRISILHTNPAAKGPIKILGITYSNPTEFSAEISGTAARPVVETTYTAKKAYGDDMGHITISTGYKGKNYAFRVAYLAFVPESSKRTDSQ